MIIYLDTETSGLYPGQICQLSYIMQDANGTIAKNFFFSVDYVEPGAQSVHGFSVELLERLSSGKEFSCHVNEIEKDFLSADVVIAHNVSFDFMFLKQEFARCDKDFDIRQSFCSMKSMTPVCKLPKTRGAGFKYPKLNELTRFLGVTDEEIQGNTVNLYGSHVGFHDARFDTVALYTALNKGMNQIPVLQELKGYL